jgi:hypothetical protein
MPAPPMTIHVGLAGQCRSTVGALSFAAGGGLPDGLERHRGRVNGRSSGEGVGELFVNSGGSACG